VNVQTALIIFLLILLVGLGARSEWRTSTSASANQTEFSVTAVAEGQYVMRADDKIFYCAGNRCTGIQLVAAPQNASRPAAPESGKD